VSAPIAPQWVTFGNHGTLVDWHAGLEATLRPVAGERTGALIRAHQRHARLLERELPQRAYRDVLITAIERAGEECGVPVPPAVARALPEAWGAMRPFHDTAAMLAALRREGYRLAVLTNGDEDLFAVSRAMLAEPFDLVISAERIRGYKPAPWHFRAFERLARVAPEDWVHVGSSPYHDIGPAVAHGVRHVWLDREGAGLSGAGDASLAASAATLRVRSGAEVPDAVACLFAHQPAEGVPAAACC
jgi:2-haloalkanoic acid dehalogenase type II